MLQSKFSWTVVMEGRAVVMVGDGGNGGGMEGRALYGWENSGVDRGCSYLISVVLVPVDALLLAIGIADRRARVARLFVEAPQREAGRVPEGEGERARG